MEVFGSLRLIETDASTMCMKSVSPNNRFESDGFPFRFAPGQAAVQAER